MNHTVNLSISHKAMDSKCDEVIRLLKSNNIINSSVVPNKSIQCNGDGECWIENGCRITIGTKNIDTIQKNVWIPLQKKFNLRCGHLTLDSHYSGCVWDFWRTSSCPGNQD